MSSTAKAAPATKKAKVATPESRLKKVKVVKSAVARAKLRTKHMIMHRRAQRRVILKRAEKYLKEYEARHADTVRLRRLARSSGNFYREPDAKLAVVIRVRGINGMAPRTRKILRLLRLRQIGNAVFIRLNKATETMLRLVEPYIAYGYPALKSVRDLIYKRGFAKFAGQRKAITDNAIIAARLGRYGIICMEDLVHEIFTVGPHFKQANAFLWTMKLRTPKGGLRKKGVHFVEGGAVGNRQEKINKLVQQML